MSIYREAGYWYAINVEGVVVSRRKTLGSLMKDLSKEFN